MDQIAEQLKAEITSLEEYIRATEERLRVTGWVAELLEPFDRVEHELDDAEVKAVVTALYQARFQFSVNGQLSGRIDEILDRYEFLVADLRRSSRGPASLPARDPDELEPELEDGDAAASLFAVGTEDEEAESLELFAGDELPSVRSLPGADREPLDESPASGPESLLAGDSWPKRADTPLPTKGRSQGARRSIQPRGEVVSVRESDSVEAEDDGAAGGLFAGREETEGQTRSASAKTSGSARRRPGGAEPADDRRPTARAPKSPTQPPPPARQRVPSEPGPEAPSAERYQPTAEELSGPVDIFSAKVSLDDLVSRMGIGIPANDRVELDHLLHNRLMDRTLAALRACPAFEKQYILIPRISRLIHDGQACPCTLKTLAKVFTGMFGNIQDLIEFRSLPFLTREVPEPGWALIMPEAPRDTLGKTYMEQNQYLRFLAATAGVPSHLVRRRTLVEAVYDLIVSRMVVGDPWQRRTLDWTATGTSKTDFVCVYYSEQGIRLRDVPRTTHNRALGFCPNW